ncbi:MAG: hypothetical protein JNM39_12280 [Bdellovibrionaceae bacterium]|nr:hypothetical protein [Pseudobdellovibrionaceae bacterium]
MKTIFLPSCLFSLLLLVISTFSSAQTVKTVKGKKALLELQGTPAQVGQAFYAVDASGKKKALLKVTQVKGDRALVDIVQGTTEAGHTVQAKGSTSARTTGPPANKDNSTTEDTAGSSPSSSGKSSKKGETWGLLGSFGMNKMDASLTVATVKYTANMTGAGFGLLGFYDFPLSKNFILRGTTGLEQFIGNGTISAAVCNGSAICSVNIMYLSFYGAAKYIFVNSKIKIWAAGGLGYLFAASKSSNILKTDGLSTYVIVPSLGIDIPVGNGFIPITVDYALYPDSADVKANSTSVRAGWGWYF